MTKQSTKDFFKEYFSKDETKRFNLRTRQELIGNNLMEVCCDYPDQIRPIIEE